MRKRVLVADDHQMVTEGVAKLLTPEFDVVGQVPNGRALVAEAIRCKPDIVVLDIAMPELNGLEAARQLQDLLPSTKLIFLTQQLDGTYIHAAFEAGAMGYVSKQSAALELLKAVRLVEEGSYYVTPSAVAPSPYLQPQQHPKENPRNLFGGKLTPRQREVLQLVAEGKSNKEIAAFLDVSVKTVDFHKSAIMEALGLRGTAELTRYALSKGIINVQAS